MLRLDSNYYLVLNTISDHYLRFDDVYRLEASLLGKRTSHLLILVVKGMKAKPLIVNPDIHAFRNELLAVMKGL